MGLDWNKKLQTPSATFTFPPSPRLLHHHIPHPSSLTSPLSPLIPPPYLLISPLSPLISHPSSLTPPSKSPHLTSAFSPFLPPPTTYTPHQWCGSGWIIIRIQDPEILHTNPDPRKELLISIFPQNSRRPCMGRGVGMGTITQTYKKKIYSVKPVL